MNRTIDCWSKCDPSSMSKMSASAIFFAIRDAKEDILHLSKRLEEAEKIVRSMSDGAQK